MEHQQETTRETVKPVPKEQTTTPQTVERELLQTAQTVGQGVRQGIPMERLPAGQLETLAALVGNSGMETLLESQWQEVVLETAPTFRPVDTVPYPVPEQPIALAEPVSWTEGLSGRAVEPSALQA